MYELFILGELTEAPKHGYLLREIINLAIGPLRQMSWGALYPLLRRLETDGFIEQVPDPTGSSDRPRKVYQITEVGRERFLFLMLRPEPYGPDSHEVFDMKLVNFDHLSPEQRRDVVREYKGHVQFVFDKLAAGKRFVVSEEHISEAERHWILRAIDHRIDLAAADLRWVETFEADIANKED